jgi:lipopolysaccharide transport system permease protein
MQLSTSEKSGVLAAAAGPSSDRTEPEQTSGPFLPEKPLVVVEPSRSWVALDLKGLWTYRELLYFITWRDVKIRYKQTVLGVAWAVLQPLLMMIVFSLFFGRVAGISSDGLPYPLFAYGGLLPWTFFSNAITNSGNSLVGSANLVTKVYFPRMIIPGAAVGASLVDLFISFILLVPLMAYYHTPLTMHLLALPLFIALATLLALGVGMWMSALNVKYRDIRFALPFLVQLWMFVSPIIYPSSKAPSRLLQKVLLLNPMTGIVEGFRSSLFGLDFKWDQIAASAIITIAVLIYSAYSFRRMEKVFADIV